MWTHVCICSWACVWTRVIVGCLSVEVCHVAGEGARRRAGEDTHRRALLVLEGDLEAALHSAGRDWGEDDGHFDGAEGADVALRDLTDGAAQVPAPRRPQASCGVSRRAVGAAPQSLPGLVLPPTPTCSPSPAQLSSMTAGLAHAHTHAHAHTRAHTHTYTHAHAHTTTAQRLCTHHPASLPLLCRTRLGRSWRTALPPRP